MERTHRVGGGFPPSVPTPRSCRGRCGSPHRQETKAAPREGPLSWRCVNSSTSGPTYISDQLAVLLFATPRGQCDAREAGAQKRHGERLRGRGDRAGGASRKPRILRRPVWRRVGRQVLDDASQRGTAGQRLQPALQLIRELRFSIGGSDTKEHSCRDENPGKSIHINSQCWGFAQLSTCLLGAATGIKMSPARSLVNSLVCNNNS